MSLLENILSNVFKIIGIAILLFIVIFLIWGFFFNPLMQSDNSERRDLAFDQLENHTLENKLNILSFCKEKMMLVREENGGDKYASGSSVVGRIYKDGEYLVAEELKELPFLEFDLIKFSGISCEIYIHKEFDGGLGYLVSADVNDHFKMFKFNAYTKEEINLVAN